LGGLAELGVPAEAFLEKFGGDSIAEIENNVRSYSESIGM